MAVRHLVRDVAVGIVIQPAALYTDADDGVPAVRGTDIRPGEISTDGFIHLTPAGHMANPRSRLRHNDVLVVRTGRAGAAARVPDDLVGANCIDVLIVRPGKNMNAAYLEHSINSHRAQEVISEQSTGAIQSHFGVDAMKALPVVARVLAEQVRIARRLDDDRARHEGARVLLERSLDLLGERKQALVNAAVTGRFDVTTARSVA
jgi:type I restriction enzyme, S subunit